MYIQQQSLHTHTHFPMYSDLIILLRRIVRVYFSAEKNNHLCSNSQADVPAHGVYSDSSALDHWVHQGVGAQPPTEVLHVSHCQQWLLPTTDTFKVILFPLGAISSCQI